MAGRSDVPLTTAIGKPSSVLRVLDEMKQRWRMGDEARHRARAMERYTYGRMTSWRGYALENQVNMRTSVSAPPIQKNKLKNALLAWSARVAGAGLTTIAYPKHATPDEQARADVANAVLDWQRQTQDRDALLLRTVALGGMHGSVGLYRTWDPDSGEHIEREPVMDPTNGIFPLRDAMGNVVYQLVKANGAPRVEAISIFDFITDGAKNVAKDGKWLLVRRWLDPDEANAQLRSVGVQREAEAMPVQNRQASGAVVLAVEAYEMWWKPGATSRFPEGFYACVVDGECTFASTFPYEHGRLPFSVWRVMDVQDDFYGATWLEDAVPQQIGLNHSLRVLAYRAEIAGQVRKLAYGPAHAEWDDSPDGVIDVKTAEGLTSVAFTESPDIPKDMFTLAQLYEQGVSDVSNVSEVSTSGDEAAQTKNARLVYNASQVDKLKATHSVLNLNECVVETDQDNLDLVKQYVTRQRLFTIIGEDGAVAADYFSGKEVGDVILRLEVAPSIERTSAAKAKDAEDAAAGGFLDPRKASELRQTGLDETGDEAAQKTALMALVQQAMAGQPVQADPSITPDVAVPELRRVLGAVAEHGPAGMMPIRALIQEYEELRQQGMQGAQPQPGGRPQPTQQGQPGAPSTPQNTPQPLVH